jgi:nucleoid DNA-binding protein
VKRNEIARTLSRQKRLPKAAARDEVDKLVHKILQQLKKGKAVPLPGLGTLIPRKPR